MTTPLDQLSDEDLQKALAGEAVKGPRMWRGRELAPLTKGLRDLRNKVVFETDTVSFHDATLLYILAEAHDADESRRLDKRRALIVGTDDIPGFRARMSLLLDELGDDEAVWAETKRLVNEIFGIVEAAEVSLAEKKTGSDSAAPNPTMTPSTSAPSRAKPRGRRNSSGGS